MKQKNLQEYILRNQFFEAKTYYPGEGADLISYLLTITMNDRSKTVYWNDASDRPQGLNEIARQIKALVTR